MDRREEMGLNRIGTQNIRKILGSNKYIDSLWFHKKNKGCKYKATYRITKRYRCYVYIRLSAFGSPYRDLSLKITVGDFLHNYIPFKNGGHND